MAVVDRLKANLSVVVFVQVRTKQHSEEWTKKFKNAITEMDEVVELYRLSGTVDYMFKVLVPDIRRYNEFYEKLTHKIDFFEVTSSFSMEEIKQTGSLPLNYIE